MGAKSFAKGFGFERDVAKMLSLWVSDGDDAYVFNRRQGSGGSGRDRSGKSGASGDLFAEKVPGYPLMDSISFELKFYAELHFDLWSLLAGAPSKFDGFIAQTEASAKPYGRDMALIFKCNRKPPFVLTSSSILMPASKCHTVKIKNKRYSLFTLSSLLETKYVESKFD